MSTSAVQHTVQIRPSRLAGLLVAVALVTAASTWSASKVDESHHTATAEPTAIASSGAPANDYVHGIVALTGEQRAAIYGNVTASVQHVNEIVALSPSARAAIYGNVPMAVGTP
jgi:hypothetical protein